MSRWAASFATLSWALLLGAMSCGQDVRVLGSQVSVDEADADQPAIPGAPDAGNRLVPTRPVEAGATIEPDAQTNPDAARLAVAPPAFEEPTLILELSDAEHDQYDPALTPDRLTIYYRSEPRNTPGGGRSEIVVASRPTLDAPWGAPSLIAELDAPEAWNLSPEPSFDGQTLWFSSDREGTAGGLDLWVSTRPDPASPWSAPQNLGGLNTDAWDTDIAVNASRTLLVFSRGGNQGADLFASTRARSSQAWGEAFPFTELNSADHDWDAALAEDGLRIVFASNRDRRPEFEGQLHLYEAVRQAANEPFSEPRLLEELAVAGAIDEDPWISNDGQHIVFTSTRDGRRHLYEASRVLR